MPLIIQLGEFWDLDSTGWYEFISAMKIMEPNDETHRAFGDALRLAAAENVGVVAYDCVVTPDQITVNKKVPVRL